MHNAASPPHGPEGVNTHAWHTVEAAAQAAAQSAELLEGRLTERVDPETVVDAHITDGPICRCKEQL